MVVSLFFWPAPAFTLVGAILLPVAIKAGLPPIGIPAPKLAADAAGIPVGDVISSSIPLVITMGVVTTALIGGTAIVII